MTYTGEHSFIGQLGHSFVILSFIFALIAAASYFMYARNPEKTNYRKSARLAFFAHVASSLVFILLIFYMLLNHYYEFEYIWEQSSEDMSFRYLLVCFWGGQQGSFMLWIFWHLVLGSILVFTSKKFEAHVMTIFALVQVFLVSMLLGVYLGEWKIGTSPFALRREVNTAMGPLWNLIPDYFIFDENLQIGKGLNPLLRNYWMTIHPPTLFLGFALTLVPFAYAIAGLWTKKLQEWIKPALPWTFFGIMVLGGGILMGGRWAYESLSFGGFWAWDPVENASLVPWIILVGAGHLMLINRHQQHSLFSTFLLTAFSFILVLLSTFLTRSGILGDSSVHSFTGEDMLGQLLLYMMFFVWLTIHLLLFNSRLQKIFGFVSALILIIPFVANTDGVMFSLGETEVKLKAILFLTGAISIIAFLAIGYSSSFPKAKDQEEAFSAREFWMFLASILLILSAFHIIYNTCQPAINMIFGSESVIAQDERNQFYNMFQVPFAMIIAFIMAFAQFLKYRKTEPKKFFSSIAISFTLALILSLVLNKYFGMYDYLPNAFLFFAAIFSVFSNLDFYARIMRGNFNHLGSSLAHAGFGLLLVGALVSQAKQEVISKNYKGYYLDFLDKDGGIKNQEDVQLFKGELTSMGDYFVVFKEKRVEKDHLYFDIDYLAQDELHYKKGDRVRFNFAIFECNADHTALNTFAEESNFWKPIDVTSSDEFYSYPLWESHLPGKTLFTLHPFVQLNKMSNVAEPGTMNYWTFDVFTHIKYADLSPISNGKMQSFKLQGSLGDTLWTAGYKIILADAGRVNDSASSNAIGARLHLKLLNILDSEGKYPIDAYPTYFIDSTGNVSNPVHNVKKHGLEIKLTNIVPGNAENKNKGAFEFEFVTPEYIVLHARIFPYITLLWWGCIIMCLGTTFAVIQRIRMNKNAKA